MSEMGQTLAFSPRAEVRLPRTTPFISEHLRVETSPLVMACREFRSFSKTERQSLHRLRGPTRNGGRRRRSVQAAGKDRPE